MQELADRWNAQVEATCALAGIYYRLGRIETACNVLHSAIAIDTLPDDVPPASRARMLIALLELLAQGLFLYGHELAPAGPLLDQAIALTGASSDELRGKALDAAGLLHYYQAMHGSGDFSQSRAYFEQALALRQQHQDAQGQSETLFHLGLIADRQQDRPTANRYYSEAMPLAQQAGAKLEESYLARHLAFHASLHGDHDTAIAMFARSIELRQELGYNVLLPLSHSALGDAYMQQGELEYAQQHLDTALQLAAELDLPVPSALVSLSAGELAAKKGDAAAARSHYNRARAAAENAGVGWLQGLITANMESLTA